jgi:NAD+ synthase
MAREDQDASKQIVAFLRKEFRKRKANVAVIGISGGIDSSVTAVLAKRALGADRVFGLILPDSNVTPRHDITDALDLVRRLKIKYKVIELKEIREDLARSLPKNKLALGNMLVRLRMILLYYFAAVHHGLVVGTGDKSEIMLGYYTKFGDGAVDLLPIADLYKTQVRSLARYLSIPEKIINKESSARLWKGHTAEKELGLNYVEIDKVLQKLENNEPLSSPQEKKMGDRIRKLIEKNTHKKEMPIVCKVNL